MNTTVILCTYNRCQMLAKALDSVAAQTLPESIEWEVLVVDNNSSDQTREVVEGFCRQHPHRFRYLFEPQQGKSYALNAGIREAKGEIVAFMDDDVTVDLGWLDYLTSPLRNGEWAGSGGRTVPAQTFTPPDWLAPDGPYSMLNMFYAGFDLGDKPRELLRPPFGANMAIRKAMFERYGDFRTDMGPSPGTEMCNEDSEFGHRLLAAGERFWYEPSAVAYHVVWQDRMRKEYFLRYWFDYGRARVLELGKRPDILGMPRYYFTILKSTGVGLLWVLRWMLALNPQRRFNCRCLAWMAAGWVVETYRQSRRTER